MKKLGLGCGSMWLVSISQKVESWSCSERPATRWGCPCGSWGHSQQSPGASGESRWLPLELTPTCSPPPPPNGASTTTLRSQHLFVVAVHLRPPLWRHCRPPDRPSPKKCSTIPDRGRDRVEQPEPDRVFSSRPASGSHDEERTWFPTSGFEVALAPKKPSEPNPPPTRKQDPIKSAQKESFQSTQHSGSRRARKARKARKCLRYLQRASHQDAPFSRSGFAVGVLRHNLGIKLDQASTLGRHVNQTLMGGKGGLCSPTDALGSHRVHCVAVEALTIRSLARSTVQRSRHDAINIFFPSRYARLFA